jgi:hypothetical protein
MEDHGGVGSSLAEAEPGDGRNAAPGQPSPNAALLSSPSPAQKMTQDQEDQFKQLLGQFKADSSPLMHVLSLYSLFFTKFTNEKVKLESQVEAIRQQIKEMEDKQ